MVFQCKGDLTYIRKLAVVSISISSPGCMTFPMVVSKKNKKIITISIIIGNRKVANMVLSLQQIFGNLPTDIPREVR